MAKPRKDWKLVEVNCVSTKDEKIEITKPKPASATVTVIDNVNDAEALLAHINAVEKNEKPLTYADILKDYVNTNIVSNARIALRQVADPTAIVTKALDKVRKMFPNLPEEQLAAMAEMMKDSIGE